ncbi:glycoside hydrolase family 13 protein [Thelephora ganbajun]|uniref:Glycoside hydrolase family 13 protein n=1 Tax=Thelephora ganbajun TaxID=370292 RepID=A0ACB6Z0K9_THEGA|nr:glycoside hydrolase family 13 protein [Thelephora ganbajun]
MHGLFALSSLLALAAAAPSPRQNPGKDIIIQLFQWNWDSIANECKDFIGPAGYGHVQVNPANEHIQGPQWWTDYQATSYKLQSKRGSKEQYKNMVDTCHAAGVKVVADVIFNHMAGIDNGVGNAGSSFSHYDYPGIYQNQDFHHCGTPGDAIQNWGNRWQVQNCQLANLADLATGNDYVRGKLADHANELLSLGTDGFRIDAAKRPFSDIPVTDLQAIFSKLSRKPSYVTQEIYYGGSGEVTPGEYVEIGQTGAFQYAFALKLAFEKDGIASLQNPESLGYSPSSSGSSNTFVTTHDTERNHQTLTIDSPNNTYTLAHIWILAHPWGTPTVLSSYQFSDNDQGAPNGNYGTCNGNGGANGWYCQHRWTPISGMVGFRNAVQTNKMTNWFSPTPQQVAFGRGKAGFVVINNSDQDWNSSFQTGLPGGKYCNVIDGVENDGGCSGSTVTVASNGKFTFNVGKRNAVAIHIDAKL